MLRCTCTQQDYGRTVTVSTSRPPQPPVMRLIQERRERLGMSKRAAAALAEIGMTFSEATWRHLEDGGRFQRGIWLPDDAKPSRLARMALVVRLTPEDIEPFSPRAAQILGDLMAERSAKGMQEADDAARMLDALGGAGLTVGDREALEAQIAESLRRMRNT